MPIKKPSPKATNGHDTPAPAGGFTLSEISKLIDQVHSKGFDEFELEQGPLRLRIVSHRATPSPVITYAPPQMAMPMMPAGMGMPQMAAPAPAAPAADPAPAPAAPPASTAGLHEIKSPMVGTFYRAPSPGAASYAQVGDRVSPDTVVCIIEAMKLMNEIKAEVSGSIRKVCVENAQPVEYGQVLFLVEPG